MHKIDVHMLSLTTDNPECKQEAEASLENANANVFHIAGIDGDIKQSRINGYSLGTAPYVDSDDIVIPEAFDICVKTLEENPELVGCYTQSCIIDENGCESRSRMNQFRPWEFSSMVDNKFEIHQLVVIRREFNDKVSRFIYNSRLEVGPYIEHYRYILLSQFGNWEAIPFIGYKWRRDGNKGRNRNMISMQDRILYSDYLSSLLISKDFSKLQYPPVVEQFAKFDFPR